MPTWDQFMTPVLLPLVDGQVRQRRELQDLIAVTEQLTDQQRSETLASGQSKFHNRIG